MSKWAPDNDAGQHAYVVIKRTPWDTARGTDHRRIEYAASLADAKRSYGWTRESHTTVTVRRATPDDVGGAS